MKMDSILTIFLLRVFIFHFSLNIGFVHTHVSDEGGYEHGLSLSFFVAFTWTYKVYSNFSFRSRRKLSFFLSLDQRFLFGVFRF